MTPYKIRQIFLIQFCSVSSLAHHFIWQLSRWNNHLSLTSRKYCIEAKTHHLLMMSHGKLHTLQTMYINKYMV